MVVLDFFLWALLQLLLVNQLVTTVSKFANEITGRKHKSKLRYIAEKWNDYLLHFSLQAIWHACFVELILLKTSLRQMKS